MTIFDRIMHLPADYKLLFESAPVNLLVLKPDLTISAVTDGYLRATGRTRTELLSKNIFVAFPDNPDDKNATGVKNLAASLRKVIDEKVPNAMPVQKYDIPTREGGFEVRYWSPLNVPVLSTDQALLYVIHRVEDLTELVKERQLKEEMEADFIDLQESNRALALSILENSRLIEKRNAQLQNANDELNAKSAELLRSNDALASFASTAAHDIQAPFRIVGNYLNRIEERMEELGLIQEFSPYLQRIYGARERIATLIEDLLAFSMVSKKEKTLEEVEIDRVIKEALSNLEQLIQQKGATINVNGVMPLVKGSFTQLVQVFQNLLGNAIIYNRQRPEIAISCKKEGGNYLFSIRDNGIGIDDEHRQQIFEVFQRLNSREEFPGTGLGLPITRRVIEHHNGTIWVESEPGKGSVFYFTIPTLP